MNHKDELMRLLRIIFRPLNESDDDLVGAIIFMRVFIFLSIFSFTALLLNLIKVSLWS